MSRRIDQTVLARRGFTLVEALASLMLVAVVLPFVIRGVSMSARNAAEADRKATAAMLAQTRLDEVVLSKSWELGDAEGEFDEAYGKEAMRYTWDLTVGDWQSTDYRELVLTVRWMRGEQERKVALTTVVNSEN